MQIKLDALNPKNRQVLQYLGQSAVQNAPLLGSLGDVPDAYFGQGSHPEIVERVWDQLGLLLPHDCRCLVYGTPALVHPASGVIFAICNGTQYNIRLTPAGLREAMAQGVKTITHWSSGQEMNAAQVLGTDWVFGAWLKDEPGWCNAVYQSLNDLAH